MKSPSQITQETKSMVVKQHMKELCPTTSSDFPRERFGIRIMQNMLTARLGRAWYHREVT